MKKDLRYHFKITRKDRCKLNNHNALVIWVTGLSGSGKSTIANGLEDYLHKKGIHTFLLDGDAVRTGLSNNLSFSPEDRSENVRRIAETCKLFLESGLVLIAAFISPYAKDREKVKQTVGAENFVEVYVNTSVEECERRDTKGLYARARRGEIQNFTGINAPYEAPQNPDIEIKTETLTIPESIAIIANYIQDKLLYHE